MLKLYASLFALILSIFLSPHSIASTALNKEGFISTDIHTLFNIAQRRSSEDTGIYFDLPVVISTHTGKEESYWGHFEYVPTDNGKVVFELTDYGVNEESSSAEDIASLNAEMSMSFPLAHVYFMGDDEKKTASYWGTLQLLPNDDGKLLFEVTSYGGFKTITAQINEPLTEGIIELYDADNTRIIQRSGATNEAGQYLIDIADKYQPAKAKLYIGKLNNTEALDPMLGNCVDNQCDITLNEHINERTLAINIFGEGQVSSEDGAIKLDTEGNIDSYKAWRPLDAAIKLTATPAAGYEVLSWSGCDLVSSDQRKCAVTMNKGRSVQANFGQTAVKVVENVYNLSAATHSATGNEQEIYLLNADISDVDTVEILAKIQVDDYITSGRDGGFLRQVSEVEKISDTTYEFITVPALLEDVIKSGTVLLQKTVKPSDLEGFNLPTDPSQTNSVVNQRRARDINRDALARFNSLPLGSSELIPTSHSQIYLKRPKDPESITLVFGEPVTPQGRAQAQTESKSKFDLVILQAENFKIRMLGEWTFKIAVDLGMDFSILDGLRSFKMISEIDSRIKSELSFEYDQDNTLDIDNLLDIGEKNCTITPKTQCIFTPKINQIRFSIGPVPIIIRPTVELKLGLEIKSKIAAKFSFEQSKISKTGFIYNKGKETKYINFEASKETPAIKLFQRPSYQLEINPLASIEAGVLLYEFLKISAEGSLKFLTKFVLQENTTPFVDETGESRNCTIKIITDIKGEAAAKAKVAIPLDDVNNIKWGGVTIINFEEFKIGTEIDVLKYTWPIISNREDLFEINGISLLSYCGTLSESKLAIKQISANRQHATSDYINEILERDQRPVLSYSYEIKNTGGKKLFWSVAPREVSVEAIRFFNIDNIAYTELKGEVDGGKTETIRIDIDTKLLNPNLDNSVLSGFSDFFFGQNNIANNLIELIGDTYHDSLVFKNISPDIPKETKASEKGDISIPVTIKLPPPLLQGAPVWVSAQAKSTHSIKLDWDYSGDKRTTGYRIYGYIPANETEYQLYETLYCPSILQKTCMAHTFTELEEDTEYQFEIQAFGINTHSGLSNSIRVRTLAPYVDLDAPKDFTATASDGQISLRWKAVEGAVGYRVINDADEVIIDNTAKNNAVIAGLINKVAYHYRIAAIDKEGRLGIYSQVVTATPYPSPPSSSAALDMPENFVATAGDGQVVLTWDAVEGASRYRVIGNGAILTTAITENKYIITGLTNNTVYTYRVGGITADGKLGSHTLPLNVTPTSNTPTIIATTPLNDTGITSGGEYVDGTNTACTGDTISQQDCFHGRDATDGDDSDGHAGFSFTKLAADGSSLPSSASTWACVQDNVTGLVWEVKQTGAGLHSMDDTYTWYDSNPKTNAGAVGSEDKIKTCDGYTAGDAASYCNTEAFVKRVNNEKLCGFSDWQMPAIEILHSIVDYGRTDKPAIDINYFPQTQSDAYWSGSPHVTEKINAWLLLFGQGTAYSYSRSGDRYVRLVRGVGK